MSGSQVQSFGYRLHELQCFGGWREASIDLVGTPQIPGELEEFWKLYGHDCDPPRELLPLIREAIEAACHVIQHRHRIGLQRPGKRQYGTGQRAHRTPKEAAA